MSNKKAADASNELAPPAACEKCSHTHFRQHGDTLFWCKSCGHEQKGQKK